jgi:hypothetical protein
MGQAIVVAIGFVPGETSMSFIELPMTRRGFLYSVCEPVEFLILLCIDSQMVKFQEARLITGGELYTIL